MTDAQMLRAQGLAILEECKDGFSPVMRLVGSNAMLAAFVAGMTDVPELFTDAVQHWSRQCKTRKTDAKIEASGIKCLTTMYDTAIEHRKKRKQAKNTPCTQDNSDE